MAKKKKVVPKSPVGHKTATKKKSSATAYTTDIYSIPRKLNLAFVGKVRELEHELGQPVYLLMDGHYDLQTMHLSAFEAIAKKKSSLPNEKIAILLHSFGGSAEAAYRLAMLLRRKCGGFNVFIPRMAKSAATLFALGADSIILGEDAELGPLDAQFRDYDVEETWVSALDTVQAVEQLEDSAIEVGVKMLRYLHERTRKQYNILLPHSLQFAAEITKPLFEKIDAVRYSRQSRILKEAQDYAEILLARHYESDEAQAIAKELVRRYPTHDFVIDREGARNIGRIVDKETEKENRPVGLRVEKKPSAKVEELLDWFWSHCDDVAAVGQIVAHSP